MRKKPIKIITLEELVDLYPNETGIFYKQKIQEEKDKIEEKRTKDFEIKKVIASRLETKPLYYLYSPSSYTFGNIRSTNKRYAYKIYEPHVSIEDKSVYITFDEIRMGYKDETREFLDELVYSEDTGCELFELIDLDSDEFIEIDEIRYKGIVHTFLKKDL